MTTLTAGRAAQAFFTALGQDIEDVLDLRPEGITQERVWLHLKSVGRKASVDQIRARLDTMTREGQLVSAKNGKNETVWKRAARGGVVPTDAPVPLVGETPSEQTVSAERAPPPALEAPASTAVIFNVTNLPDFKNQFSEAVEKAIKGSIRRTHEQMSHLGMPPPLTPVAQLPENPTVTPPVDPPAVAANQKPIAHRRRKSHAGAAIEAAVLDTLHVGMATRKQLMDAATASGTGVDNALKRLADRVERTPAGLWALKGTASGGAAQQPLAAPPRAQRSPAKAGTAAGQGELDACLTRFTQRLQPVTELGEKVAVLDQLCTVLPKPIAERLVQIRADLVRVGS